MEAVTCRLLPYADADGPANMAADETMLHSAAAGVASLRCYGWSAATVSLGYFQPARARVAAPRMEALPFVRRPSGGAALVHDRELTYALALPAGPPWQPAGEPATAWLLRAHRIIAAGLAALGVACSVAPAERPHAGPLCFRHVTPGDLVIGSHKVVGSAQRRLRGALLQHGGILLAASPHAPELPGLAEAVGRALPADTVRGALITAWARQTGWELVPGDWTAAELSRIAELTRTKYTRPEWNGKR